jgi:hypothetical protein
VGPASIKDAAEKLTTTKIRSRRARSNRTITWSSQDGATIEGILHKPVGFQTGKRYPLLTHPRRPDRCLTGDIAAADIYPIILAAKVRRSNRTIAAMQAAAKVSARSTIATRGGDTGRRLGVDHLVKLGLADACVGTMGWRPGLHFGSCPRRREVQGDFRRSGIRTG